MAILLNFVLATALVALLFSRIHFHFSFGVKISQSSRERAVTATPVKRANRPVKPGRVQPADVRSIDEKEIASALINQGCEKGKALAIARNAISQGNDFDSRIRWALKNAA